MYKELPLCPVETTLTLISDKWKILILRDLNSGTKRFGELKKSLDGISQKVLTSNLRHLEESGLLSRKVYAEMPPRVEYTMTDLGKSLEPVLSALAIWGLEYQAIMGAKQLASPPSTQNMPQNAPKNAPKTEAIHCLPPQGEEKNPIPSEERTPSVSLLSERK